MSREFTLFQFDVDEKAVRRVLSSIPGVTPLPPDEGSTSDDGSVAADEETRPPTENAGESEATDAGPDESAETTAGSAGVEAHLDDPISTGSGRMGARKWTGPSTPWPGAPGDEEESDAGLVDRLREKRTLLIGGAVAVLGVVSAVAVWYLKFRGDGGSARSGGGEFRSPERTGATAGADSDRSEREPHADDDESRSYPVDAAPVIGMAFLAVGSLLLRHLQSGTET